MGNKEKRLASWEVSDALWERVEPLLTGARRRKGKKYLRKPGGGRKPLAARRVFGGIVFVLRTGIQWKALPERFGSATAVHRHFLRWMGDGVFLRLWQAGLAEYDEMEGIAWDWQSVDGGLNKAPLAQQAVGPNPTDRGKKWHQTKLARRRTWRPAVPYRQRRQST